MPLLRYEDIQARALEIWREKQKDFPPRVVRQNPDDLDMASGSWANVFFEAARDLGWKDGEAVTFESRPNAETVPHSDDRETEGDGLRQRSRRSAKTVPILRRQGGV